MDRQNGIVGEINALKILLDQSDYQMYKLVENISDCNSLIELMQVFKDYRETFRELVANRRTWRAKINELEEQLGE